MDQVRQTLEFSGVGVYKVMARVLDDGVGTCRLSTSGAAVDSGNQDSAAAGAWVTVEGTFTTAAPDTVDINLITVTATQVCVWDHVAVYRIDDVATDRDEISQPGIIILHDSCSTCEVGFTIAWDPVAGVDVLTLTVPSPGAIIEVFAYATFYNVGGDTCRLQITENIDGAGAAQVAVGSTTLLNVSTGNVALDHVVVSAVGGSSYEYVLEAASTLINDRCRSTAADHQFSLTAKLTPTR